MKSHHAWVLAVCGMLVVSVGQAMGQYRASINDYGLPTGVAQAYYTGNPYGNVIQASQGCDSCAGMGCDGCLGSQGLQLGGLLTNRGACGGCGSSRCDGGCGGESQGSCGCGAGILSKLLGHSGCDGACGGHGILGGGALAGAAMGANPLHNLNAHRYGGYDSQLMGAANGPFGNGGCCAPRHYDVHAEWMYLKRDRISSDPLVFSTHGIANIPALSTDDLGFDPTSGARVTGAYIIGPSTTLEATYFGSFNWTSSATAIDPANLYSVFSNYGQTPLFGFPVVDRADSQSLFYGSQLDNGELNLRQRWVSANCLLHGSYLAGVRYVSLTEDFRFTSQAGTSNFDYLTYTQNDMIGFQLGTDMFICVSPRFKFGGELKAGIYGNRATQNTVVSIADPAGGAGMRERASEDDAALVGEGGVIGIFRVTPRLAIRGGYQFVYLNGVALAIDNFNSQAPLNANAGLVQREPRLDDNSEALYHGATLGVEWTW